MLRPIVRLSAAVALLGAMFPLATAQDGKDAPKKPAAEKEKPAEKAAPEKTAEDVPPPPAEGDYRQFFKKPQTVAEYWNALQFEIDVGRYDLAGTHLHGLLALKPSQEDLFKLAERVGMAAILRLRNVRTWVPLPKFDPKPILGDIARMEKAHEDTDKITKLRAEYERRKKEYEDAAGFNEQARQDVETLIQSTAEAVRKTLEEPERIKKFVHNLTIGPEEKAYALKELDRSARAVAPFLIEEWRGAGPEERPAVLEAMRRLSREVLPGLAAALDSDNANLKVDLIDVFQKRGAVEVVPELWFVSASPTEPEKVRDRAVEALSYLLDTPESKLPPAKVALTRQADRYYRHEVPFANPRAVTVWKWNGQTVTGTTVAATRAEEYYGMRYAGQALALDPGYRPAQVVLLSLALEKAYEQAGAARPLAASNPAVHDLLGTVNPDLVVEVLERALDEKRFYVILGAVRALGEFAEGRASRPRTQGEPVLVRALNYPDRRIQMAAAEAILRTPHAGAGRANARVVEVLRRAVAGEQAAAKSAGKVLVGFFNPLEGERVEAAVAQAGFEPVPARTGRAVVRRLGQAADIDVLVLDAKLPDPGLASLLGQLRADRNASRLPVLLAASPDREEAVRRFAENGRNITVVPVALLADPKELQAALRSRIAEPASAPLSEAEAREYAERAIRDLDRMARGEPAGFDIRPAAETILSVARSGALSPEGEIAALDAAGHLTGARAQTTLADAVLAAGRPAELRAAAADILTRHIQRYGALLTPEQVQSLEGLFAQPGVDARLKRHVAVVLGSLRPDSRQTGERLRRFRPVVAPPADGEKEKEKEDK